MHNFLKINNFKENFIEWRRTNTSLYRPDLTRYIFVEKGMTRYLDVKKVPKVYHLYDMNTLIPVIEQLELFLNPENEEMKLIINELGSNVFVWNKEEIYYNSINLLKEGTAAHEAGMKLLKALNFLIDENEFKAWYLMKDEEVFYEYLEESLDEMKLVVTNKEAILKIGSRIELKVENHLIKKLYKFLDVVIKKKESS